MNQCRAQRTRWRHAAATTATIPTCNQFPCGCMACSMLRDAHIGQVARKQRSRRYLHLAVCSSRGQLMCAAIGRATQCQLHHTTQCDNIYMPRLDTGQSDCHMPPCHISLCKRTVTCVIAWCRFRRGCWCDICCHAHGMHHGRRNVGIYACDCAFHIAKALQHAGLTAGSRTKWWWPMRGCAHHTTTRNC